MKAILPLLCLLVLASCVKVPDEEAQRTALPVIQGVLISGDAYGPIHVDRITESGLAPVTGAQLSLETPDGPIVLSETDPGKYMNAESTVLPSADYQLTLQIQDELILTEASTPPLFGFSEEPPLSIDINPNIPFQSMVSLDWEDVPQAEFLLILEVLDENSVLIPFPGNAGGNFELVYYNPQPESGTLLLAADFRYFGPHRLTVFAIPGEYSALFNPEALSDRQEVPFLAGSVEGGFGYLAGITPLVWEFNVE